MKRLCIQWPRFGPYHLARLRAAHAHLGTRGVEGVGLETAARDATYAWRTATEPEPFRRVQLFPEHTHETILPGEMRRAVWKALDRLDPAAVAINSYSFPDARACLAWCRAHRRVAILMTPTKADDAPRVAWREGVKSVLVRQFDAALVGGTPQRAYLEQLGFPAARIFDGYNVVDNAYFQNAPAPPEGPCLPGLDDPSPFFLAVGRFVPFKNFDGLVRAYLRYHRRAERPWRLVLVGDGPERARLEALAAEAPERAVTFAGFRQIEALATYYRRAGAFVLPSHAEPWGLVVNEAMASGLPVLVSEGAGCAHDLVAPGENGFRFDPADLDQLAELMAKISSDPLRAEAMGRAARDHIAGWSPQHFAEGLERALEAGTPHADRPLSLPARFLLGLLDLLSRRATSFHRADV